ITGTGSSWHVKAKAAKGTQTATSTAGDGATLRAKSGSTWYASRNLSSLHQQILRDAARELKQPDPTKPKDLRAAYDTKAILARQLEAKGQAKIDSHIQGIKFDITLEPFDGVKHDREMRTKLLISPNYEELEINVPASGDDTFRELVERLQNEVMSKNPYHNQDVILGACAKIADAVGASMNSFPRGGGGGKSMVVRFTANDATGERKAYDCEIMQTRADNRCASCGQHVGEIESHNVVSQHIWQEAVNHTLIALGIPATPVSPFQRHITGIAQLRSAAFGDAQKQCPHCETPGLKTGRHYPNDGADLSLIQRSRLPNAKIDPSITGNQFGGTDPAADHEATTAAHVKKVLIGLPKELRNGQKLFPNDSARSISSEPTMSNFITTLEATVRTLARL
ncbi:MAG TPA: hypothetical protein VF469_32040, partial [Kofleriaceae bacterium]